MDGFKDSTRTQYSMGGSCKGYAKGGSVKGAAKVAKVMGEFKAGDLHSGSKKGPKVTDRKQAIAISLSEARKAGTAKAAGSAIRSAAASKEYREERAGKPEGAAIRRNLRGAVDKGVVRKASGGLIESTSARPTRNGKPISDQELGLYDTARPIKARGLEVSKTTVRAVPAPKANPKPGYRDTPIIGPALGAARDFIRDTTGYKKGGAVGRGLAVMPRGKNY